MTVFSLSDLKLIIGGQEFTADKLADVSISKRVDGIGTSGISTSQISAKVFTSWKFEEGTSVNVQYSGWEFPTYYIDKPNFDGIAVSFAAYDRCKDLDIPFDYSNYSEYPPDTESNDETNTEGNNETDSGSPSSSTTNPDGSVTIQKTENKKKKKAEYLTSDVLGNLVSQVGFEGLEYTSRKATLKYEDLKDKTCREIVQTLTEADCGTAYCGNDNSLRFVAFNGSGSATSIKEKEYSAIVEQSFKSITKIIAEDTHNSKTYSYGTGDYRRCLMISGTFLNKEISGQIASQLFDSSNHGSYEYLAFSVEKAIISSNVEINGQIFIPNNNTKYIARNINIEFGALYAVATLSSPQIGESKATYMNKLMRIAKQKVQLNATYNTFFVNENGSGHRLQI